MKSHLKKLMEMLPPPKKPKDAARLTWARVEDSFGVSLPTDYKNLIKTYGTGTVNLEIYFFNPFAANPNAQLSLRPDAACGRHLRFRHQLRTSYPQYYPYKLFPEPEGWLPCGGTDTQAAIFWVTGKNSNKWSIAVDQPADRNRFELFRDESLTSFFEGILSERIHSEILGDVADLSPYEFET